MDMQFYTLLVIVILIVGAIWARGSSKE